jgi:hypothetical protein
MTEKPLFEGALVPILIVAPILVLAIGGIWALRARPNVIATLERGEHAGREFAATPKTANECLDGALDALDQMPEPREPGCAAFLEACLTVSGLPKSSAGAKHTSPTRGAYESWSRDECAARGRGGDKSCALLLQLTNVDPCGAPFRAQTKTPAKWECPAGR